MSSNDAGHYNPFTAGNIASREVIANLSLSPNGHSVLYSCQREYKEGDHDKSSLWLASVSVNQPRQLTSGLFNDHSPAWHPNGSKILFLSDRHKAGDPAELYILEIGFGEPIPLFGEVGGKKKGINQFVISPDGRYVAFTRAEEPSEEQLEKEKLKDDAKVFGDKSQNANLHLWDLQDSKLIPLVQSDRHVESFFWASDSASVFYTTTWCQGFEFTEHEMPLASISISGEVHPSIVGLYPRAPADRCIHMPSGAIVDIQSYNPTRLSDSSALFIHPHDAFSQARRLYGDTEDVEKVVKLNVDNLIAVEIASGVHSRIDIVDVSTAKRLFVLYETKGEALSGGKSWDVKRTEDENWVIAAITSSPTKRSPPNIWTASVSEDITTPLKTQVTQHNRWLEGESNIRTWTMRWKADDGVELLGIVTAPAEPKDGVTKPLPTILHVHGGPYYRTVADYDPNFYDWRYLLASRGYLVLAPNYRGGSGFGSKFARAAHGGMGTVDWSDCESMLEEAIRVGLADPKRLGICGWSQGGFMTAWGVAKTKNRFKAGVMGAGVSDWGQMAAESDMPEFELDLGGSAPWTPGDRKDLEGSPIRFVEGVETAVLILHGEKDERVPATQGISFMRGLRRYGKYPDRSQLVIYPREPHDFKEKKHAEDVMKRVIDHFHTWLPV